jgi:sporulation protein YlmC with PRC-barrel domain
MRLPITTVSAAALLAAGATAAVAQSDEPMAISSWNYDALYGMRGLRGEELLDAEVYDATGEEVGEVENVVIEDDRIVAIVAEVGGFWDMGDSHVVVPWDQLEFADGGIVIPVNEDNVEEYDAFAEGSIVGGSLDQIEVADDGDVAVMASAYRLTDLIDDYATADGIGYGYVDDVIFSEDGSLEAVVVTSRGGYYAYPYYGPGYGYSPYGSTYELGYEATELEEMEEFDYAAGDWDWW